MATYTKLPSGNIRAQVRHAGHRPISRTFTKKSNAIAWARSMEGDADKIDEAPDAEAKKRTLGTAIDAFLLEYVGKDTAIVGNLGWWKDRFGDQPLVSFTDARVAEALRVCAAEPIRRGHGRGKSKGKTVQVPGQKKAGATVNRYHANLSTVLQWAKEEMHWIARNNARGLRRRKESKGRVRWLNADERTAILAACDASKWPDLGLLVRLALTTGARLGELLWLRWEDVDLKAGTATLDDSKNSDPRILPIIASVKKLLEAKVRPIRGGLIFAAPKKPEQPFAFRDYWNAAKAQAKLENFRFHDNRHDVGTTLAKGSVNAFEIAAMLGHRSLQTTKKYVHIDTKHKQEVAERVLAGNV